VQGFTGATVADLQDSIGDFFDCLDGDDSVAAGAGADTIIGGLGNDTILGGLGDDRLTGDNFVEDAGGSDLIDGGAGNDTLLGDAGADRLTGGAGSDRFGFSNETDSTAAGAGRDVIFDFDAGTNVTTIDWVDLSRIDADATIAGNQSFIFGGPFTAGHIRAVQSGANALLQFNTDADSAAEMTMQLNNVLVGNLNAGDFVL
jgi:serralysin